MSERYYGTGRRKEATARVWLEEGEGDLYIPSRNAVEFAIGASVIGQLLSYYTAELLGRDIDQPRNLAKSVTVG